MQHAYLIIANKNPKQLQMLIDSLDDSRNDIYLIVDRKSTYNFTHLHTQFSSLNFVKPINIYWGDYSIVDAELRLFRSALPQHYSYYHLLSGMDFPLQNQDYIHTFFDKHKDKEFIGYGNYINDKKMKNNIYVRIKHHLFRRSFRNKDFISKIYRGLERRILQYFVKSRIPNNKIGYASQWLSIDDDLVQLIVNSSNWIKNIFQYTLCPDELFIPTLLNFHMEFLKKIYYNGAYDNKTPEFTGNLRFIKFKQSKSYSPCVWTINNLKELHLARSKGYLFSRKFDDTIDSQIVYKIFNHIMN